MEEEDQVRVGQSLEPCSCEPRKPGDGWRQPEVRGEAGRDSCPGLPEGTNLDVRPLASRMLRDKIAIVLSHSVSGNLAQLSQETNKTVCSKSYVL